MGRGAHPQHGRAPARLGHLAPARVGRADRRLLLRRAATTLLLDERAGRARGRDHARRARAPTRGTRARRRELLPAGTRVRRSAGARRSARRPTSSTSGSTRAAATPRCSRRARSCAGRPTCTSRARTSTAAGSTPRCWRRWARASAPPYQAVLTHGFVVDGDGPQDVEVASATTSRPTSCIPKYGAEVLRLWVAARGLHARTSGSPTRSSNRLADAYRRIRNTCRFLLGNLADFDPERDRRPYERLDELDRWALLRLGGLIARVRRAYEEYEFHVVFHARPQLLRGGPLGALPRHHQGPALHVGAGRPAAARRADGRAIEVLDRADAADGADPDLHRRGGLVAHLRAAGKPRERAPRRLPGGARRVARRAPRARTGSGCSRCAARSSRALEAARQQGEAIGKGIERGASTSPSAPEEQWRPLLEAKGEPLLTTARSTSRARGSSELRGRRTRGAPTRARTSPGSSLEVCPRRRSAGRSASAAGRGARAVGEDPEHPALCERCAAGRPRGAPAVRLVAGDSRSPSSSWTSHQAPGARAPGRRADPVVGDRRASSPSRSS